MASHGWETLAPHGRLRQLCTRDGRFSLAGKHATKDRVFLDVHLPKGWAIIVLSDDGDWWRTERA